MGHIYAPFILRKFVVFSVLRLSLVRFKGNIIYVMYKLGGSVISHRSCIYIIVYNLYVSLTFTSLSLFV